MSAYSVYLNDFFNDPNNTEEYKINFLKNYYYSLVNCYFNVEYNNFQIGVTKNRNLIYFGSKLDNNRLVYNIREEKYYEKINNDVYHIDLDNYKTTNRNTTTNRTTTTNRNTTTNRTTTTNRSTSTSTNRSYTDNVYYYNDTDYDNNYKYHPFSCLNTKNCILM